MGEEGGKERLKAHNVCFSLGLRMNGRPLYTALETKMHDHDIFFLKDLCEVAKVSRIVVSGGFRCGAMFRKGDRFYDPPRFLPSSVMV